MYDVLHVPEGIASDFIHLYSVCEKKVAEFANAGASFQTKAVFTLSVRTSWANWAKAVRPTRSSVQRW